MTDVLDGEHRNPRIFGFTSGAVLVPIGGQNSALTQRIGTFTPLIRLLVSSTAIIPHQCGDHLRVILDLLLP
jgi:hypothetical protein